MNVRYLRKNEEESTKISIHLFEVENWDNETWLYVEGESIEDVIWFYQELSDKPALILFSIVVDGWIDVEATMEVSRWFSASKVDFIPRLPLEPSILVMSQKMKAKAVMIQLTYPQFQITEFCFVVLKKLCILLSIPIFLESKDLLEEQKSILTEYNCQFLHI